MEALFRAYFTEGRDVGHQGVLGEIAKQAGLPETTVAAVLDGAAGAEEVRREAEAALRHGISGVPTFLLDGKALFSGALPPEQIARRLAEPLGPMPENRLHDLRVVVGGGSIGGLCAGVAPRGVGADVQVFERHAGAMEARGAGIVVQPELTSLLHRHGAPPLPSTSWGGGAI